MFDFISNEYHHRHVFYLDANGRIHSLPEAHFARLQAGEPDAALPGLAGQRVRFAVFRVVRLSDPMRIVDESFSVLPLDAQGNLDAPLDYDALQADVDRLEARDYAPSVLPAPPASPASPVPPAPPAPPAPSDTTALFTSSNLFALSDTTAPPTLSDTTDRLTAWAPDSFTHRRLIAALLDAHHHPWPTWWPQHTDRAA
ncbi:MAG: hypothetical protein AAGF11_55690 [Myxococcota bacterium]